jgi:hypothetical protein
LVFAFSVGDTAGGGADSGDLFYVELQAVRAPEATMAAAPATSAICRTRAENMDCILIFLSSRALLRPPGLHVGALWV